MEEKYLQLINEILEFYSPEDQEKIREVISIASTSLTDKVRENGHPFIEHPINIAHIIATEVGLGADAIMVIFLHEASRFNPDILQNLSKKYSGEIMEMVEGLNKIALINPKDTRLEADNYKRLIVSYSRDPRVTIIKLADRLEVMRNLSLLPPSSQLKKVPETMLLYIPIAHQLGLYRVKSELEDIVFKYNDPEHYRAITNKLKATEKERDAFIESFIGPLQAKLDNEGLQYKFKSRTKTAYSIFKKMNVQGVPFEGVYDVFAIRIIIDCPLEKEVDYCWKVYSIVTEEYQADTSRLRDWLTKPKPNGYESLHTTVQNREGTAVEVQIRSQRMDDIAENGHAAHWSYKGVQSQQGLEQWLQSVRHSLESNDVEQYEQASSLLQKEVFVFSPDGKLHRLKAGACVLDFAFDIHTNLGIQCSGAKIDGKAVSIREKLQTGNMVEILKNKNQKPSPDWLNFVVTSKARARIKIKLKEEENKRSAVGKELLERRLKNWKLEITDDDIAFLGKKYKYRTINELFAAIGEEKINLAEIKSYLTSKKELPEEVESGAPVKDFAATNSASINLKKGSTSDFLVIDDKLGHLDYKMAKCCNPVYGDDVFGFVSTKGGIKIHRISCPNAARLLDKFKYRTLNVKWNRNIETTSFQTSLKIIVDEYSVFNAILGKVAEFNILARKTSVEERNNKKYPGFNVNIQLLVSNTLQLDKLVKSLEKIKGVQNVLRV